MNLQGCSKCHGTGRDKDIICENCNGSGYVKAISIGMICEYNDCNRKIGKDYKRPKELQEKGWEDEPIYLCDLHACELKVL